MNHRIVDLVARSTAGMVSRRGSLRLLGGAALTGALAAPPVAAGKARKKNKKRCKPGQCTALVEERCQQQLGQCLASVAAFCQPQQLPAVCEAFLNPCCEHIARCEAGQGITCLFAGIAG